MLAHDLSGPTADPTAGPTADPTGGPTDGLAGRTPIVLIHAGIADRRMWNGLLPALTEHHDVVRLDLRGFGESDLTPDGSWSHAGDVLALLDSLAVDRAHLVGCSQGSGVAAEVAVRRPSLAASLVLSAPGGALFPGPTEALRAFWATENEALERGDIDAAVEANLRTWVDGTRFADEVPREVRAAVAVMQRRAFDIMLAWPDEAWEAEQELDPPLTERLAEIIAPILVITGALDVDAVEHAARAIQRGAPHARTVAWPDVAHLPSMERPDDFAAEVLGWIALAGE
jgi:pimeloyl-ACP methyl ester carboxylesterase